MSTIDDLCTASRQSIAKIAEGTRNAADRVRGYAVVQDVVFVAKLSFAEVAEDVRTYLEVFEDRTYPHEHTKNTSAQTYPDHHRDTQDRV